jgi:hypothetical protein
MDNLSISEVAYSTFLGTDKDDMLVKLRKKTDNLGFMFFSARGQLRELEDCKIP